MSLNGCVVLSADAWINLKTTHHYASTFVEAAALGINAGMDQEGGFGTYSAVDAMPAALAAGTVTSETVKEAFRRCASDTCFFSFPELLALSLCV